jgi:hypothetical protein
MAGRTDSEIYKKSLLWCQNFIPLPQGDLQNRPGSFLAGLSKNNYNAVAIPFQFSALDAIMIIIAGAVTGVLGSQPPATMRFYRNGAVILNTATTISAGTNANPCQITSASHGLSNGQEVYISGVVGMPQLNDRFFLVAGATTNTFTLQDPFGNAVNSTAYGTYISGGTVASIYELATPYQQNDLTNLRYAQIGDQMYIDCQNPTTKAAYAPYILTRSDFTSWTLATYSRTNDPFAATTVTATGATQANPCVITTGSTTGLANGAVIQASGFVGTTQLNGNFYIVQNVVANTSFSLTDLNGNAINSTGFSAYSSGGTLTLTTLWPAIPFFTGDGRLGHTNTLQNPEGFWASELPSGSTSNFTNFTTGSTADTAMIYNLAPVAGIIDSIADAVQFSGNIGFLGASSVRLAYGAQPGTPPTPLAISIQPTIQGALKAKSLVVNWDLIFIDVNQKKLRGMQYNLAFNDYQASDYNLISDHLGKESPFIKQVWVKGIPEIIWLLRADGVLLSFTFNNIENIAAWARHYVGGNGQVIDIGAIRNSNGDDELWMVVQRTINGVVFTSIEVLSQWPQFPDQRQFYSPVTGQEASTAQQNDLQNWASASWEAGKDCSYLDTALTYDGHDRGNTANATITPSGTTGAITITSNNAVFQASDVGQQIWKDYSATGSGGGQATITGYTSSTSVSATVKGAFDNTNAIAPGDWGFAVQQIVNLQLFEGQTMGVQADGGKHPPQTVTGGLINLQWFSEVVQVGFGYVCLAITPNLAPESSKAGSTASKPRAIKRLRPRFCQTIGCWIGTSLYNLQEVIFRQAQQIANRVPPPFTGIADLTASDMISNDTKQVVMAHFDPSPCTISTVDVEFETNEPP